MAAFTVTLVKATAAAAAARTFRFILMLFSSDEKHNTRETVESRVTRETENLRDRVV